MSSELKITGLTELREALKQLPPELVHEGAVIVHAQAEEMARHVRAYYAGHRRTGNLEAHLTVTVASDAWSATARVKNTAKHAHIFEHGTGPRPNGRGGTTGSMPKADDFIPVAIQRRRVMLAALIELVERAGLTVTGSAA